MTRGEIIKALQCCSKNTIDDCEECPAYPWNCEQVYTEAVVLLNDQQELDNRDKINAVKNDICGATGLECCRCSPGGCNNRRDSAEVR